MIFLCTTDVQGCLTKDKIYHGQLVAQTTEAGGTLTPSDIKIVVFDGRGYWAAWWPGNFVPVD